MTLRGLADTAGRLTGTVAATGQLVSDTTGTTYSYDPAGNLLGNSDGDAFVYDDYGRTTTATAGGVVATGTTRSHSVGAALPGAEKEEVKMMGQPY